MSALTPESLRTSLNNLMDKLTLDKRKYTKTPQDHSRTRKLSFKTVITSILQMSGGSINHELLTYFDCSENTPTASAFVQQRSKILPDAFEALFHSFSEMNNPHKTYKDYRVLAVDGSDLHIPTSPKDTDSYFAKINEQGRKRYIQILSFTL